MFPFTQLDWSEPRLATAGLASLQVLIDAVDAVGEAQGLGARARRTLVIEAWSLVHGLASLWHGGSLPATYPDTTLDDLVASVPAAFAAAVARHHPRQT